MATTAERIGIVETKVVNLDEKLDNLKTDVKEIRSDLSKAHDGLQGQLGKMYEASCEQHANLAKEINNIKSERDKLVWTSAGVIAAIGFITGHWEAISKFF